jgi:hypothetical protein
MAWRRTAADSYAIDDARQLDRRRDRGPLHRRRAGGQHGLLRQQLPAHAVSWLVPPTSGPSDYDMFARRSRNDLESAYNIERTRIYGWGFSAGAHVMHDLAINTYSDAFNAEHDGGLRRRAQASCRAGLPGPTDAGCGPLLQVCRAGFPWTSISASAIRTMRRPWPITLCF